jgi:threonine dehydrogenase-like Zn-dependent dehydrogenase
MAGLRRCATAFPILWLYLVALVLTGEIDPGKVFDLTLPLVQVAEGYRAMDERRAIKALLRP